MEVRIRTFIETNYRQTAGLKLFDDDTPLFSTGIIDSFGVLELIAFLEDAFDVEIDTSRHELSEFDTIRKISALVAELRRTSER